MPTTAPGWGSGLAGETIEELIFCGGVGCLDPRIRPLATLTHTCVSVPPPIFAGTHRGGGIYLTADDNGGRVGVRVGRGHYFLFVSVNHPRPLSLPPLAGWTLFSNAQRLLRCKRRAPSASSTKTLSRSADR